ncbi:MAG: LysM peptidoglycan-binding domain-containing protein [Verrucomicrobia bacterium]|nr:LysM peptidoglycan-binding domain-containing protein [Verrucomicrobiota bacterium]
MIFKTKFFFLAALIFAVFSVPAYSQQISQAKLAGLLEDVAALRSEVARLRTELEELRAENARLLQLAEKKVNPADDVSAKVASLRAEMREASAVQRREITAETDEKIKTLGKEVNRALADLSRSVNAVSAGTSGAEPIAKPKDFPESGIEYTVKAGDTLGKIISKNRSKQSWILYANPGLDPNKIFPGQVLFVPQKN